LQVVRVRPRVPDLYEAAGRGDTEYAWKLDRNHDARVCHFTLHGRVGGKVRARDVHRRMREILALVPFGRHDGDAVVHREADGALLSLPDRALGRVVAAVEQERVGEVAVVRDVDVVGAGPDERTDHSLG